MDQPSPPALPQLTYPLLVRMSSQLTWLTLAGRDRLTFANNFCTHKVRELAEGRGQEAFICTAKGHTLGHGIFWAFPNELAYMTVAGQAATLLPHWDRYIIREQVELADQTNAVATWLVCGNEATWQLAGITTWPEEPLISSELRAQDPAGHEFNLWMAQVDWLPVPSWLVRTPLAQADAAEAWMASTFQRPAAELFAPWETFDLLRVAGGYPWFGGDITTENLPQEVARDQQAISFTKGCYLGQETVARIDALGHVNQLLRRIWSPERLTGTTPLPLFYQEKPVGRITSIAPLPDSSASLGLAYLRRNLPPGAELQTSTGTIVYATPNK
ncbi:MAG: hypothetical protein SFX18_19285 [Pirellulales bacterium]|nr:hypothetical protein [Pirellulales bacterium]